MQNKKYFFAPLFLILIIFLVGFFLVHQHKSNPFLALPLSGEGVGEVSPSDNGDLGGYSSIKYVELAGQNIKVDLATTESEQAQGLSGRTSLASDTGMLFIFPEGGQYLFWMKDMNFPIDMIWIDQNLKVIYIKQNATPESYPETFGPSKSDGEAKYVLEVEAGFSDKNNLKVGDSAKFVY